MVNPVHPDAVRGQVLLEESREAVVVLDEEGRVVAASKRARQTLGVREGDELSPELLHGEHALVVPYTVNGRDERLVYLSEAGDLAAYEELRSGFTAAVSHELRTPLARLLSLLEQASLPGENVDELVEQARREIDQITELIDEVLFLAELESGTRVVSLGAAPVLPVLRQVAAELEEQAARAGVALHVEGDPAASAEVRPRMMRVVVRNLAENAIRYAGPGASAILSVRQGGRRGRPTRRRRRRRGRTGRATAHLRALLPHRPLARLAWHGPGARDREARRRLGRRDGRGAGRAGTRARDPLFVPHSDLARSPAFHEIFTIRHPRPGRPVGRLAP